MLTYIYTKIYLEFEKMIRVLIAGGFDPIHSGHIDHITKARGLGDELIVILQTDENLLKKKGWCLLPIKIEGTLFLL